MSVYIKKIVPFIILILCMQGVKSMLTYSFIWDYGTKNVEYCLEQPLTMNEVKVGSPLNQKIVQADTTISQVVRAVGIQADYGEYEPFKLVQGNFVSEYAVREGRNIAVISETLSERLFHTQSSIGNQFELDGFIYEVIGVYKDYTNGYQFLRDDGIPKVYVPITSECVREEPIYNVIKEKDRTFTFVYPDNLFNLSYYIKYFVQKHYWHNKVESKMIASYWEAYKTLNLLKWVISLVQIYFISRLLYEHVKIYYQHKKHG